MLRLFRLALLGATLLFATAAGVRQGLDRTDLRQAYAGPVSTWPKAEVDAGVAVAEFAPLPPLDRADAERDRQVTLGARLFDDPHLSRSGQVACASCHNKELGFGDGLRTSFGHDRQRGQRNAPSLYTAGLLHSLFWDGRSPTLEHQALQPIANRIEMAGDARRIEHWINHDPAYRSGFYQAFGVRRIAMPDIARALASYERSLRPPRSAWDKVLSQGAASLTDQQLLGLHLFRTKARCMHCHNGPLLSDQQFHNLGISFYGRQREDVGRYAVSLDPRDVGRFRTPSLRAVRRTGPYMHNGLFPTLEGVVNLYVAGGGVDRQVQSGTTKAPPPQPDPLLRRVALTAEERAAIVAFLEIL